MSSILSNDTASAPPLESETVASAAPSAETHTYDQILKSSALVGGSQVVNIAIRIVRTKVLALLLGPGGFGLFGLYSSVMSLTQTAAEVGVNSSGVRQIAEAVGTGDEGRIAMTAAVLRRTAFVLASLGAGLLLVFCRQVSTVTFGTPEHAYAIVLLSGAVFCQLISDGQGALIQGMRRILDLAKMGVLGAVFGAVISIITVFFLRERGVVPALVGISAMTMVTSWWYARKIPIPRVSVTFSQVKQEATALLKLGFAFMAAGFMTLGIAYAVRIILLRKVGLAATGVYQAAWTLGGFYVSVILQSMGADFYPRLTASAKNNPVCNRLVNEQIRVGLLLAGPGVLATLTFAPLVINLFYSAKFGAAVGVLRWICLGTMIQVTTWPMALIVVAKGKQAIYFGTESAWTLASIGLAVIFVGSFGLNGAGMAFFGSNICYAIVVYPVVRSLSGFRWSGANKRTGLIFLVLIAAVFSGFYRLSFRWAVSIGTLALLVGSVYSIRVLLTLVAWEQMPRPLQRLLTPLAGLLSRIMKH